MKRRTREPKRRGPAPWMTTYADMVTLILVFFILLFSMSQIDVAKFRALIDSYSDKRLNFNPSIVPFEYPSSTSDFSSLDGDKANESEAGDSSERNLMEADELEQLVIEINEYLSIHGLEEVITANRTERGVVLVLQESVLFETGQAAIIESAEPFLDKVGMLLTTIPNPVKVEGHTDNRPISTMRYPSNWELSAARAASVIRYLESKHQLDKKRFTAVGYGETRPVVENDGPEGWQKNRRVEIVISDPNYVEQQLEQ